LNKTRLKAQEDLSGSILKAYWSEQSSQENCINIFFQEYNCNRYVSILENKSSLHLQHCQEHNA